MLLDEWRFEDMNIISRRWYTQNKQRTPVTTGILPFSSNSTISRPNSSACLRWNDVVRLVDLDMVIARASLPLVWDLYVFTLTVIMLWSSWCVWKYKNVPRSHKIHAVARHALPAALLPPQNIDYGHMSYFVRRHFPYLVHFVCLKIKRTNLWGLDYTHLGHNFFSFNNGHFEMSSTISLIEQFYFLEGLDNCDNHIQIIVIWHILDPHHWSFGSNLNYLTYYCKGLFWQSVTP